MSTDSSTPERVTLTDEERFRLVEAFDHSRSSSPMDWAEAHVAAVEQIVTDRLAARDKALREKIAGECRHADVETFRTYPSHTKCLDCGQRVEQQWVTRWVTREETR